MQMTTELNSLSPKIMISIKLVLQYRNAKAKENNPKQVPLTGNKKVSIQQKGNKFLLFTLMTSSSSLTSKILGMKPATKSPIQSTADKKIYFRWMVIVELETNDMRGENEKEKASVINFVKDSYLDYLLRLHFCLQVPPQQPKQDNILHSLMLGERQQNR